MENTNQNDHNIDIQTNWKQIQGKLKEKYGDAIDDDLTYLEGKSEKWVGYLHEKLDMSKDQALSELRKLADRVEEEVQS